MKTIKALFSKLAQARPRLSASALVVAVGCLAASCSMMEDDLSDCPTGLYVGFTYDYNIQRADMFKDQVGGVTLYVVDDATDRVAAVRSVENTAASSPLAQYGYRMHFTDLEPGRYRLYAMAQQRGYASALATPGAKFRRTDLAVGQPIGDLSVTLDRSADADAEGRYAVDHANVPLDTLWMSLSAEECEVSATLPTYATVPLIRDTKNVSVTLRQADQPAEIDASHYTVEITDRNGRLGHDNEVLDDTPLLYTPYDQATIDDDNAAVGRTARYDLSTSRLMYHGDQTRDPRLVIRNNKTGKTVVDMDLASYLAIARNSDEAHRYSEQEFLDREHNYKLTFFLVGDVWKYVDIGISIASWGVRVQNLEF